MTPHLRPVTDTENAILEAARDLLAERGPAGLSMRAVAARVGVTATTIYNYFENKKELVDRVVLIGFRRFEDYLRNAIVSLPKGSPDRLYAIGEAYIRFALEHQAYFRVLFTMATEHPREIEDLPAEGGYQLLRQAVVDAMEAGYLRREDPDIVALYLWAHVHGLVTLCLACRLEGRCPDRELSAPELFARFRVLVRDGIRYHASN